MLTTLQSRISAILDPITSLFTYRIRHGLARGLKRNGGLGFLAPSSTDLSKEEAFLANLDLTGGVVYDIGSYEGLYAIFFASKVGPSGHVVCFEPIPESRRRIQANLQANGFQNRVMLHDVAIGEIAGQTDFVLVTGESRGQASGHTDIQAAYSARAQTTTIRASVIPLDALLGTLPPPTLIKIDVEGMELAVIRGARQTLWKHQPALFIEMHGATREAAIETMRSIIRELQPLEYIVRHVETGVTLDPDSTPLPGSLHLYATV